jgi:putative colanic acid biosynthesis acetyltransferase WcaF
MWFLCSLMSLKKSDLSRFDNSWYNPGPAWKRVVWYMIHALFFRSAFPVSSVKIALLRMFGARIGKGVVIKPHCSIKYPWNLTVGDYTWLGEEVWIDNLDRVTVGSHCCISQGALLLCGNHDYTRETFDLITRPIVLEDGVWVGAKSTVCPGVTMREHAVLSVGSVLSGDAEAWAVMRGNPAVQVRTRAITR